MESIDVGEVSLEVVDQMMKQMASDLCEKGISLQKLELDNDQNK